MKKNDKKQQNIASVKYDPKSIEPIWQAKWEKEKIYHPDLDTANPSHSAKVSRGLRPFYNLMMFPYPSAEGLHIGGVRTFAGVDIYGRFKRMQGANVFQPFGLDGFGIHAENYALKIGANPMDHAKVTESNFYRQVREAAIGVDWERTVETYKPDYYKWTQWLFVELFKAGLAYRKKSPVNFCPSCKTVLADEQVIQKSIKGTKSITGTTGAKESKISENQGLDQRKSEKALDEVTVKVCERCETEVEMKDLEQWFFRITKYADRLLNNIDGLDWTEKVKIAQRNWIGKKEGIEISYPIVLDSAKASLEQYSSSAVEKHITVFTTRPDTNFGATFIALAPEHPLVEEILRQAQDDKKKEIREYVETTKKKTEIDRQAEGREKTGVFTGFYALNPLTGYKMPIWVSDFVLMGFGTGAVVGVPGHDTRDFDFARKFGLKIIRVVVGRDGDQSPITKKEQVQEEEGKMINSDFLNGLDIHEATEKIMDHIEEKKYGKRVATYHLRDWLISRQRYWGPPIPMIFCENCAQKGNSWFTSDEAKNSSKGMGISNFKFQISNSAAEAAGWYPAEDLPVELPYIEDFKPLGSAKQNSKNEMVSSPLANHPEFYKTKCPGCGADADRETDVSDTFLDSSWYFLRYLATEWDDMPFPSVKLGESAKGKGGSPKEIENLKLKIENSRKRAAWLPVHMYIGGAEHSVLHLLYARFITMFLHDRGLVSFEEPFARFYAHGLIIKDGAKMSKSKGNVVGPDLYIKKYGADALRMYLHFLAPFSQEGDFRDSGIEGMSKFLKRVWTMFSSQNFSSKVGGRSAKRAMNEAIKRVTEEMEALRFNTAIAHLMTYYNFLAKQEIISLEEAEVYLKLLAPFAPHMTEELFQPLNHAEPERQTTQKSGVFSRAVSRSSALDSIHVSPWPQFEEKFLVDDTVKIPVQVNGKLRGMIEVQATELDNKQKVEKMAQSDEKVAIFLQGKQIKKIIYIIGKVVNFVI